MVLGRGEGIIVMGTDGLMGKEGVGRGGDSHLLIGSET